MPKSFLAVATLTGTIIGVGFLSLPYVTLRVGFWMMLAYLVVLGVLATLIHSFFGQVALKTPDFKRLPGYAELYLGKKGKWAALISSVLASWGALLAYIIIGGEFLTNLLVPVVGGNNVIWTGLYFALGSIIIYFGIKTISRIEFFGLIAFFLILIFIFSSNLDIVNIKNIFIRTGDAADIFLPYGVVLFALWGANSIPETEEIIKGEKGLLKFVIPIATMIPVLVYIFFIILVTGVSGYQTSTEAISGLKNFLGDKIIFLAFLAGLITTFSAFLVTGLTLKKIFWYDMKIPKNISWLIACFVPFILFLLGVKDFIKVIGFVGAVMLAIGGILILLMYRKTGKNRLRFLTYPLIFIFVVGIIYEIIYFF